MSRCHQFSLLLLFICNRKEVAPISAQLVLTNNKVYTMWSNVGSMGLKRLLGFTDNGMDYAGRLLGD